MNDQALLEKAIAIAVRAHTGQVDKSGEPYILHPLRVMMAMTDMSLRTVAVLHDVLEDTTVTLSELQNAGFDSYYIESLLALTRGENEVYTDFILRCAGNCYAQLIKIADIEDNLDHWRRVLGGENDLHRIRKYTLAHHFLTGRLSKETYLRLSAS